MKNYQYGGLLLNKIYNNTFEAIYEMIRDADDIQVVYMESLKGFVFKLLIDKNKSKFNTINDYKSGMDKRVDSLIFKFAIIANKKINLDIEPPLIYKGYELNKQTEDLDDVINESYIQQHIYLESLKETGNPISPGLADYSYFTTDQSFIIFDQLIDKSKDDEVKKIFKYLKEQMSLHPVFNNNISEITPNDTNKQQNKSSEIQDYANENGYYLSLITMENAQSYYQLNDLWGSNKFTLSERSESCFIGIAQLLRLFLQFGIVHCDCHGGNILVKIKDQDIIYQTVDMLNLDVKIIDYGRYINIYEELQKDKSKYISTLKTRAKLKIIFSEPPGLNLLENKLIKLHDEYVKVQDEPDSEVKEKLINTIINVMKVYIFRILLTDLSYNVTNFNYYNIQCSFLFKALKLIDIKDQGTKNIEIVFYDTKVSHTREKYLQILEKLYFLIHPFTSTDEFSNEKIESLKQEKKFAKIDNVKVENHSRDIVGLLRTDKYKDKPVISNNNFSPIEKKRKFTLKNPFRKKNLIGGKKTRKK